MSHALVSSVPGPAATGLAGQSHIFWAANDAHWWAIYLSSTNKIAALRSTDGITWTAPTGSPITLVANHNSEGRNFGFGYGNLSSTDLCHIMSSYNPLSSSASVYFSRTTLGTTWTVTDAETNFSSTNPTATYPSGGFAAVFPNGGVLEGNSYNNGSGGSIGIAIDSNVDAGTSWTTGFSTTLNGTSTAWWNGSGTALYLGSDAAIAIYDNATTNVSSSNTGCTNLQWRLGAGVINHGSASWGSTANVFGSSFTDTLPGNWGACARTTSDVHAVALADNSGTYVHARFNGTSWSAGDAIGSLTYGANINISLVSNGSNVWAAVIDNSGNLKTNKWTSGSGWGGWTTQEAAGANTRAYVTGAYDGSANILWAWTETASGPVYNIVDSIMSTGSVATTITLTGPTSGTVNVASTNFTVTPNGTATDVVTPHSTGSGTFTPSSLTFTSSSTPQTFTYTPSSTSGSPHSISITDTGGLTIAGSPIAYTVNGSGGTAYTSKANGNWATSGQTTWNQAGVPGVGDTVTITHNITVTADTTIGDGSGSAVLTCLTGTLTITGATFTLAGQATFGQTTGGTLVTRLTVQNSGGTAGALILDGTSGTASVVTLGTDTQVILTGTSSAHCSVSSTSGHPFGHFTSAANSRAGNLVATYTDFLRIGDASTRGWQANINDQSPAAGAVSLANCTVNTCGILPYVTVGDGTNTVSLTTSTWSNGTDATQGFDIIINANITPTTGTRLISGCLFMSVGVPPFINGGDGFNIINNYFHDGFYSTHSYPNWASFDGNFIRMHTPMESTTAGPATNNFMLMDPATNGFSYLHFGSFNVALSGNVAQSTVANNTSVFDNTEHPTSDYTYTITDNLLIPNSANGDSSGDLGGFTSNRLDPGLGFGQAFGIIEHNTIAIGTDIGADLGSGVGILAGSIQSYLSNIFWRTGGAHAGTFAVKNIDTSPVVNTLAAVDADYNGWFGLATVPPATWGDIADGTVYSSPMSGSTPPGVHDVGNANPTFVDATRNIETWDSHKGGPGTVAGALALIQADPTLTESDLIPWIRAGFLPTNVAYKNAAHDGTTIGAVQPPVGTTFFLLSPGRTPQAGGSITVTATGTGTTWTGVTPSSLFTVTGGTSASISSTSVINDTLATFTLAPGSVPASLTITDASTGNTETFLVTGTGTHEDIGSTTLAPACGAGPALAAGWSGVPGSYWSTFLRSVATDAVSPYNAAWQALMAATQGPTIQTGFYGAQPDATGTNYGNTVVGMPVNQVPGNTPTQTISYWEYPDSSDAGPIPLWQSAAIEGWPSGSTNADNLINGTVAVTNGSAAVVGTGTNFTELAPGDRVSFGLPATTIYYTILSVTDNTRLALTSNYGQSTASGIEVYGPFNRPPTFAQVSGGDSRALILVRDEGTGEPAKLWEVWKPSYDVGTGWQAGMAAYFNLATGAQRPDGWTSTTAGGTPTMPFLVTYDEAASGTIAHPLRGVIASGIGVTNKCIWPCTHASSASARSFTEGAIPTGSVIRLNAAWLAANRASFAAIIRPVLDAAHTYGLHVNDYTSGVPFVIDWSQDSRWTKANIQSLWAIPVTAFELVDSIKPQFTVGISAAPYTTGNAITFTVAYVGDTQYSNGNTNFDPENVYLRYSTDGGVTWSAPFGVVVLSTSSRSGTTTFTPVSSGNYIFRPSLSVVYWLPPANVMAAISTTARNLTTVQDGQWDDPDTWGECPPASGDTATIDHAIVMIGDAVIGDGSGSVVLTIVTGTLAVIGCTFAVRGNTNITNGHISAINSAGNTASIIYQAPSATTYTLTAPSPATGQPFLASGDFTVTPDGEFTGTITPHDGSNGGTFTPTSLSWVASSSAQTFTYTAASAGAKTISGTNNGGLGNPSPVTFTAYTLVLIPSSQSVGVGVAASLTATLAGGAGSLSAFKVGSGTLSTTTPTSGVPFTLTTPGSGSGTDMIFVTGPGGTSANARVSYPVPLGQGGSLMMMGMGS